MSDRQDEVNYGRDYAPSFSPTDPPKLSAAQQLRPTLVVERAGAWVRGRVASGPRHLLQVVAYVEGTRWEAMPAIIPDRRGAWSLAVPRDRAVAVYVASRAWSPPPAVDRRPRVDRMQVFAERELRPM